MKEMLLYYNPQLKEEWKSGNLKKIWKEKFPKLFTDEDYRIVNNQKSYHFGEWFAAIIFFLQGYHVFIEKYTCGGKRPEQIKKMKEIMGEAVHAKMMQIFPRGKGAPDLFVFDKESKKFFFVEVKVDKDKSSDEQDAFSKFLEDENIYYYVLHLKSQHL